MKLLFSLTCLLLSTISSYAQVQLSPGSPTYKKILQTLHHIYDTNIEEAYKTTEEIGQTLPGHPVYPLLHALTLRAAYYPIDPESKQFQEMRSYLYDALDKSKLILQKTPEQPEANFFALISYGLLAMYESEDGNTLKAVSLAKDAYEYMKRGFALQKQYPEFYFSSGLYNYYREKYPELHPAYRPFVWVFKSGDIPQGLAMLQKASETSIIMQAEAKDYLSHIYLRYEEKPAVAWQYADTLVRAYPNNLHFVAVYLDASLASGHLGGLMDYVHQLNQSNKSYFLMLGHLFQGMVEEKVNRQWQKAETLYQQSLEISKDLNGDGIENYNSYAYAGLARIALHKNDKASAQEWYRKSAESAQYPQTAREAEQYFKE